MKRFWMQFLKLGSFILVTCVAFSCASNSKSSDREKDEQTMMMLGKNAAGNKPVAPNSAEIIAVISSLSREDGNTRCSLKIQKVLSVGSSAGGLATGTKISAALPSRFDESQITQLSESQEAVKVKLNYQAHKKFGGVTDTAWEISEIIN